MGKNKKESQAELPVAPKVPALLFARALLVLVAVQVGLSLTAFALDVLKLCDGCGGGSLWHVVIALGGVAAYTALLFLAMRGRWGWVFTGIFLASGVHGGLVLYLLVRQMACPPCIAAAGTCLVLAILALSSDRRNWNRVFGIAVPAFVLAMLGVTYAISVENEQAREVKEQAALAVARNDAKEAPVEKKHQKKPKSGLVLNVFEKDDCRECKKFRAKFLPLLQQDFPNMEIAFHPSEREPWVRKTPTILLGDRLLFEGLPVRYIEIRDTVRALARLQSAQAQPPESR